MRTFLLLSREIILFSQGRVTLPSIDIIVSMNFDRRIRFFQYLNLFRKSIVNTINNNILRVLSNFRNSFFFFPRYNLLPKKQSINKRNVSSLWREYVREWNSRDRCAPLERIFLFFFFTALDNDCPIIIFSRYHLRKLHSQEQFVPVLFLNIFFALE